MKKRTLFVAAGLLLSLASCRTNKATSHTIYTSFYPIYDFTKRIVGDKYKVVNITPAGSEPHDYEPKAKDVDEMKNGAAIFPNGLGLETWTGSLPKAISEKIHVVSTGIETNKINGVVDPHIWLSVPNAIQEMGNILKEMKGIDKDNATYFQNNYDKAVKEFERLHTEYKTTISGVKNKYLVVSHAAFGYLCKEYEMTQIYVSGLTPDDEPTPKAMEDIIRKVGEYNITTVFYEELVSPEISKKIAQEAHVKTETLNPLEGLTEEELKTEDYLSVMRDNLKRIEEANR